MDIKEEIRKLRPNATGSFTPDQWNQLSSVLDILDELKNIIDIEVDEISKLNQKQESLENSIKDLRFNHVESVNLVRAIQEQLKNPEPQAELKPCPFCESDKIAIKENGGFYRGHCGRCDSCGPCCVTEKSAGDKWNRRSI